LKQLAAAAAATRLLLKQIRAMEPAAAALTRSSEIFRQRQPQSHMLLGLVVLRRQTALIRFLAALERFVRPD
jgi:hypothetical protein